MKRAKSIKREMYLNPNEQITIFEESEDWLPEVIMQATRAARILYEDDRRVRIGDYVYWYIIIFDPLGNKIMETYSRLYGKPELEFMEVNEDGTTILIIRDESLFVLDRFKHVVSKYWPELGYRLG